MMNLYFRIGIHLKTHWVGTYSGSLPCTTCSGVETELKLTSDNMYVLTQFNFNKESEAQITEGKTSWKANDIVLENFPKEFSSNVFKLEKGIISMFNNREKVVTDDTENAYVLTKNGNVQVENQKWKLVELYGKKVKGYVAPHYIVFHSEDSRVEAKAGCNQLTFGYKLKNGLMLETISGISTMMACPDEVEEEFKKIMMEADNISVIEKTLTLNKGRMAPLAVFEIVK
jgi:copper homeostasis protein (lipoprotein)